MQPASPPHVQAFKPPPLRVVAAPAPEFRGYRLAPSYVEKVFWLSSNPGSSSDSSREHGAITPLAPLLQTSRPWLALVADSGEGGEDLGMFALIRLNADRVCLEAVELAQGQSTYGLHLSARFVGSNRGEPRVRSRP